MPRVGLSFTLADETQGEYLRDDGVWATPAGGDISAAWPVGSVFTSVVSTNPATLLGFGTWEAIGAGRVLMGVSGGQSGEETGGSATHTLSVDELPSHGHNVTDPGHTHVETSNNTTTGPNRGWGAPDTSTNTETATGYSTQSSTTGITLSSTGGGQAFSLLPPWLAVYFFKRTA